MLIENYYTVLSRRDEDEQTIFEVALNKDCKVYEGHFPGEPVSPGVCNIQMIRELAEQVAGHTLRLEYISQCRFTTLITPLQHPTVEVRISLQDNRLTASIGSADANYLTLKAETNNQTQTIE